MANASMRRRTVEKLVLIWQPGLTAVIGNPALAGTVGEHESDSCGRDARRVYGSTGSWANCPCVWS
jgi:hypothetical protein